MEATLAGLGNRVFLMNNVHDDEPVVFQTRWAMSYLRGPLTRGQIKTLMDPVRSQFASAASDEEEQGDGTETSISDSTVAKPIKSVKPMAANRPILPAGIREQFVAINERVPDGYQLEYRPGLLGKGKVHFVRKADGIDVWRDCFVLQIDPRHAARRRLGRRVRSIRSDLVTERRARRPRPLRRIAVRTDARQELPGLRAALERASLPRRVAESLEVRGPRRSARSRTRTKPTFVHRLAPLLEERLKAEREKLEKSFAAKLADAEDKTQPRRSPLQHAELAILRPPRQHALGRRRHGAQRDGQGPAGPPPLARSGAPLASPPNAASNRTPKSASKALRRKRKRSNKNTTTNLKSLEADFRSDQRATRIKSSSSRKKATSKSTKSRSCGCPGASTTRCRPRRARVSATRS